jgi:hypothetical protein
MSPAHHSYPVFLIEAGNTKNGDWLFNTLRLGNPHKALSRRSCNSHRFMVFSCVQPPPNVPPESLHICRASYSTCTVMILIPICPIWIRRSRYQSKSAEIVLCHFHGDVPSTRLAISEAIRSRNAQIQGLFDVTRARIIPWPHQ